MRLGNDQIKALYNAVSRGVSNWGDACYGRAELLEALRDAYTGEEPLNSEDS